MVGDIHDAPLLWQKLQVSSASTCADPGSLSRMHVPPRRWSWPRFLSLVTGL